MTSLFIQALFSFTLSEDNFLLTIPQNVEFDCDTSDQSCLVIVLSENHNKHLNFVSPVPIHHQESIPRIQI